MLGRPDLAASPRYATNADRVAHRAELDAVISTGPVLGLLPPPESADWDWRLDPIPVLGEHTEPVLRELGFSAEDLAAIRAEGVVAGE